MSCAPIDTDGPRFYVSSIEGYPIHPHGHTAGNAKPVLVATVVDSYYGSEHGRSASNDAWVYPDGPRWKTEGRWIPSPGMRLSKRRGREGALAAAEARCAELNAWHEREGWDE